MMRVSPKGHSWTRSFVDLLLNSHSMTKRRIRSYPRLHKSISMFLSLKPVWRCDYVWTVFSIGGFLSVIIFTAKTIVFGCCPLHTDSERVWFDNNTSYIFAVKMSQRLADCCLCRSSLVIKHVKFLGQTRPRLVSYIRSFAFSLWLNTDDSPGYSLSAILLC
jgi:hypothetical protein